MKKLLLLALAAVMSVAAHAQFYAGGTVGAWRGTNSDKELETTVTILPEVGYSINEKFAVGTTIGWEYKHVKGINTNVFQIMPYGRYNFLRLGIVNIFCDATVGFGVGKTNYNNKYYSYDDDAACIWTIGLKPGMSVRINDKCSVVAHIGFLGYRGANNAARNGGYTDEWGLKLSGNDLSLSFSYHF